MLRPAAFLASLAALWLALSGAGDAAAQTKLKYAGTQPLTHHNGEGQTRFAARVKELTGGAVEVEVFPAGQLGQARDIPTAIVSGSIDMGFNLTSVWSTDPVSEMNDIPFLFADTAHVAKAWAQDGKLKLAFSAEMEKRGMKTIGIMHFGSLFDFGNNQRLIKAPDDLKGLKIRGYGKLSSEGLRALGASPVVMSPGEMYLGIQNGTIDGAITGVSSLQSRKIWEVTKFSTVTGATYGVMAVNMSLAKWKELKPEHQQALAKAADEVAAWSLKIAGERDKEALEFIKSKGIQVHVVGVAEIPVWRQKFEPAVKAWHARANNDHKALLTWVESIRPKS